MSRRARKWAWRQDAGCAARKCVLLALAELANDEGVATCGNSAVARACNIGVEAIRQHLATLEAARLIDRIPQFDRDGAQVASRIALAMKSGKRADNRFVVGWRNRATGATGKGIATFDRATVEKLCAAENAADPTCDHYVEAGE